MLDGTVGSTFSCGRTHCGVPWVEQLGRQTDRCIGKRCYIRGTRTAFLKTRASEEINAEYAALYEGDRELTGEYRTCTDVVTI